MQSRRQQKVARVLKEAVSDAVSNRISDPRMKGLVSVTDVNMSPDLKNANIALSIFGIDEKQQLNTYRAIEHARSRIQAIVADRLQARFCPTLHFHLDESLKKGMEIIDIINQATKTQKKVQNENGEED
ncbi:MAG: 30S ribosome-binding factor RbfA [Planctomycetes bacterium]|nr:30S ribosome-binding factor RbfA [Planctomycetota bacterium]MBL7106428.1 30S ribosome-binding factor RbfA [Phycisphaerae bacterium]